MTETSAATLPLGAYALDPLRHVLVRDGRDIQLSPLASRLVQLLAKRPGEVVERREIIDDLWRGDWLVGDPALTRLVSEIRSAIGDDKRSPTLIQTVPRRGYRLVVSEASAPAPAPALTAQSAPGTPVWQRAWGLANISLALMIGGTALILTLAILSRVFR